MALIALAHRWETTRCARSSDAPHGVFPWACLYIQQVRTIFTNYTPQVSIETIKLSSPINL